MSTIPTIAVTELPTGLEERIDAAVQGFLDSVHHAGGMWISAVGGRGIGRDHELEKILIDAENRSVDRVLDAVGLSDEAGSATAQRALIRSYGQMARAVAGEWLLAAIDNVETAAPADVGRPGLPGLTEAPVGTSSPRTSRGSWPQRFAAGRRRPRRLEHVGLSVDAQRLRRQVTLLASLIMSGRE